MFCFEPCEDWTALARLVIRNGRERAPPSISSLVVLHEFVPLFEVELVEQFQAAGSILGRLCVQIKLLQMLPEFRIQRGIGQLNYWYEWISTHGGSENSWVGLGRIGSSRSGEPNRVSWVGPGRAGSGPAGSGRAGPGRVGSGRVGPGRVRPGRAGQSRAGSGRVGSSRAGSSRAGSGRAGSDRVGPGWAGSGRDGSGRVGSGRVGPGRAGLGQAGSGRIGPGRTGSDRVGPGRVGPGQAGSGESGRVGWADRVGLVSPGRVGPDRVWGVGPGRVGRIESGGSGRFLILFHTKVSLHEICEFITDLFCSIVTGRFSVAVWRTEWVATMILG